MDEYTVLMTWDEECKVWVAQNDEIPFVLESESFDELLHRCCTVAPEILEENNKPPRARLNFITYRRELAVA